MDLLLLLMLCPMMSISTKKQMVLVFGHIFILMKPQSIKTRSKFSELSVNDQMQVPLEKKKKKTAFCRIDLT